MYKVSNEDYLVGGRGSNNVTQYTRGAWRQRNDERSFPFTKVFFGVTGTLILVSATTLGALVVL